MALVIGNAFAVETDVESDWEYFSEYGAGIAFNIDDLEESSLAYVTIASWRKVVRGDVGLINFKEQMSPEGDDWWRDLRPAIGVSGNLFELAKLVPNLEPIFEQVPSWITLGVGAYIQLQDIEEETLQWMIYLTIKL